MHGTAEPSAPAQQLESFSEPRNERLAAGIAPVDTVAVSRVLPRTSPPSRMVFAAEGEQVQPALTDARPVQRGSHAASYAAVPARRSITERFLAGPPAPVDGERRPGSIVPAPVTLPRVRPMSALAQQSRQQPASVHVTVGHVEIRASATATGAPKPTPRRAAAKPSALSLNEYLQRREARRP
jgi:hypothetical protein